jgi:hypothetical protein
MEKGNEEILADYERRIYRNTKRPLKNIRKEINGEKLEIASSNLSPSEKAESLRHIQNSYSLKYNPPMHAGNRKTVKKRKMRNHNGGF